MKKEEWKQLVIKEVDRLREDILALGDEIYRHPETGYREFHTTQLIADKLDALGLKVDRNIAYTGCKAAPVKKNAGPTIAVLGELDSLICSAHPDCNPENGYMHACGHNIQVSVMYGVAAALTRSGVLEEM